MRLLSWLLSLLIVAAGVGGFAYLRATRPVSAAVNPPERVWRVAAQPVRPERQIPEVTLYATLEAPRRAAITAAVTGYVDTVAVDEGDAIAAGQLLVALDPADQELLLDQRAAELRDAEAALTAWQQRRTSDLQALKLENELLALLDREVQRLQSLKSRDLTAQTTIDVALQNRTRQALTVNQRQLTVNNAAAEGEQLQARRDRAKTARDQAILDRQRTRVLAPFAGIVQRVSVAPRDRVRPGEPLVTVYQPNELVLRGRLPQAHLATVYNALNRGATLTATAVLDDQTVTFALDRMSGDQAAGGVDGLFQPLTAHPSLRPGRVMAVQLALPAVEDTLALPYTALYSLDRLYLVRDGRLLGVPALRVGERRDADGTRQVLVQSDAVTANDLVVTTQLPNAVTGLRVEAIPTAEPVAAPATAVGNAP